METGMKQDILVMKSTTTEVIVCIVEVKVVKSQINSFLIFVGDIGALARPNSSIFIATTLFQAQISKE